MKVLYVFIILLLVLMSFYLLFNKKENFLILENNNSRFKFINNEQENISDDFGDIVKEDFKNNDIQKYIEGFENDILREKFTQEQEVKLLPKTNTPRYVWTYWENKGGRTEPYSHIKLCFETMKKHFGNYNFIILDANTIKQYLPDIRNDLNDLLIAQKVDYYRVALLQKYGGIWIDADTIVLKNLDEIFDKLDNGYDFTGFGCTGKICFNGYPDPSNGVMGSRKNGILMSCCLKKLDKMLDQNNKNYKYFELGKNVIWECKDELKNYDYYHFSSEYDGSRDIKGRWIHSPNHLSETPTTLLNENKAIFIFLANYELMNDNNNKWFLDLNREQILNGKMWISELFRKALNN